MSPIGRPAISVFMVSANFHPYVGGAEKQALELAVALSTRGVRARVLTRRISGLAREEVVSGIVIERLWCLGQKGFLNSLSFMASLFFRLLNDAPFYDAVHVHLSGSPALAAALAARLLKKPVWVKLGGGRGVSDISGSAQTISGRIKLILLARLKPLFIAVSMDAAQEALEALGRAPMRIIPNGVDTQKYRPAAGKEKAYLRSKLGWPAQGLGFVYAGRFSPEKRLAPFLELWAENAHKLGRDRSFFALIGDGVEKRRLESVAAACRVSDRVFILPPTEDVRSFYAAADIFALPSVSEGLSNALLEAMSCGLAVLAGRVGGTTDAIADGRGGFLFNPENPDDARFQIRKFLERPDIAADMGMENRETAEDRYSLERVADVYRALYESAVA
ncbi:MAG: glycosyltransferase family 4 protein [Elusimicrobiota bacterium]